MNWEPETPVRKDAERKSDGFSRPDMLLVSDLKRALRLAGCPLCRLLRNADLHYLRVFLREGKDDGRMLLRLLGSWGLCAWHAGALVHLEPVESGDGLGTGTLYGWLLDQARRRLEDLRGNMGAGPRALAGSPPWGRPRSSRQRAQRLLRRLARTTPCPPCEAQERYAEYVVQGFLRALESASGLPAIQEMFLACEGLCLPHWHAVLRFRPSSGVHELIRRKQHEMVTSLKAALDADLDRGVMEGVSDGEPNQEPAYARALAAVAGDTTWQPPRGEKWPTH